jgi:SDR family mycofactocin-dependent oxidoreductase
MGKLDGKVALITGAARSQGRSHAVRLAQEGADIIAIDVCRQVATLSYPLSTPDDLAETASQVKALDRQIVSAEVDVRDVAGLRSVVDDGAAQLGRIDIVVANAGILGLTNDPNADQDLLFREVIDINLVGVWNTVTAAAPRMIADERGGSIVLMSSTQGLSGRGGNGTGWLTGYGAAKHGVVGLMRSFSHWLAPHNIRVNSIHPTGIATDITVNETMDSILKANPELMEAFSNLMPVPMIEAMDVSNAIAWLVSDEARYVTGVTLPVDAGFTVK